MAERKDDDFNYERISAFIDVVNDGMKFADRRNISEALRKEQPSTPQK
jgi:hypothetical protein